MRYSKFALLAMVLAVIVYFRATRRTDLPLIETPHGEPAAARLNVLKPLLPAQRALPADTGAPTRCTEASRRLILADLSAFARPTENELLSVEVSSAPQLTAFVRSLYRDLSTCPRSHSPMAESFQNDCNPDGPRFQLLACANQLALRRALLIDLAMRSVPIESMTDEVALGNRLVASTLRKSPEPAKTLQIAERLLELRPRNADAARVALDAALQLTEAESGPSARDVDAVGRAVERLETLSPGSEQTREARLEYARLRGDTGELLRLSQEYQSQPQTAGLGKYYQAWANYLQGNREEAGRILASIPGGDLLGQRAQLARQQLQETAARPGEPSGPAVSPFHPLRLPDAPAPGQ